MGQNLLIGGTLMVFCLSVQCVVLGVLLRLMLRAERKGLVHATIGSASRILIGAMLLMMTGVVVQIAIWAGLFYWFGEFDQFADAFYHSMVNFSTLGYGDMVMSEKRRLLGAIEATNGILMFGLITGFLYTILNEIMRRAWAKHHE